MQLSNPGKKMESFQPADRLPAESFLGDSGKTASSLDNPLFNPLRRMTASFGSAQLEGWILQKGESPTVRVAPWVINVGKRSLTNSLVGFLKHLEQLRALAV